MAFLRVVTWNIGEGLGEKGRNRCPEGPLQDNSCQANKLNAISTWLASMQPDLVLLNEAIVWNFFTWHGVDQVSWIGNAIGLPHREKERTAALAARGDKYVVVMSRFPLQVWPPIVHSRYLDGGGYATLHVSFVSDGVRHHVFSTRFTAWDAAERARSHDELSSAIRALPPSEPVIVGGDFNWGPDQFRASSGLRNVFDDLGFQPAGSPANRGVWSNRDRIDHLFVRGPFRVMQAEHAEPVHPDNPSDHAWVFAELLPSTQTQAGWRYCNKCQGLFFAPNEAAVGLSRCSAGGTHASLAQSQSFNYSLGHGLPDGLGRQNGWRYCNKCQGFFFASAEADVGRSRCPAGGSHASLAQSRSFNYGLLFNQRDIRQRQKGWRYCNRCQSLFFAPDDSDVPASRCPAGGSHSGLTESGSFDYQLLI
jgi:endonuclease/exonuclease/phosphatase family metal-dependent hydrolase